MSRTDMTRGSMTQLEEQVSCLVPGFCGYARSDSSRDDDGRVRVEVCERLDRVAARLEDFLLELSEEGWNPGVKRIDQCIRRLEAVRDEITGGGQDYPGLFEKDLGEGDRFGLLERDLALLVELESAGESLDDIGLPQFSPGHIRGTLALLDRQVSAVEGASSRRLSFAREIAGA